MGQRWPYGPALVLWASAGSLLSAGSSSWLWLFLEYAALWGKPCGAENAGGPWCGGEGVGRKALLDLRALLWGSSHIA